MSKKIAFSKKGFEDYLYWQTQDKKTFKKINELLNCLQRESGDLIGKFERLQGNLSGFCSMRINQKDRLIYKISGEYIETVQCRSHYADK
jgi:toxin YoeB